MPLQIVNRDITSMHCDAIVNPTDRYYSGRGGTDYAIHTAAGEELRKACDGLPILDLGDVQVTPGFQLPCDYVFHTRGPRWYGGRANERILLRSCYINSLLEAEKLGVESIAFPLISSGTFGFPKDSVLRIAIDAISDFLLTAEKELEVYICVLRKDDFVLSSEIALSEYLSDVGQSGRVGSVPVKVKPRAADKPISLPTAKMSGRGSDAPCDLDRLDLARFGEAPRERPVWPEEYREHFIQFAEDIDRVLDLGLNEPEDKEDASFAADNSYDPCISSPIPADMSLTEWMKKQDDSFAVLLLKLIDKKGMGDVECYKKANVSKKTFWKIKNEKDYRPSKQTIVAFAIALELSMEETQSLLRAAGHALARNNTFDRIIEFYITKREYDLFEINSALYKYDQPCLGC